MVKSKLIKKSQAPNKMISPFPQDKLKDYAHPIRIKNAYNQSLKKHPLFTIYA